jgi:hypothetical protein
MFAAKSAAGTGFPLALQASPIQQRYKAKGFYFLSEF